MCYNLLIMTRRQTCWLIWIVAVFVAALCVNSQNYDIATAAALVAISFGVPLARAFTEHSK